MRFVVEGVGGLFFLFLLGSLSALLQNYLHQNTTNQFVILQYACWVGAVAIQQRGPKLGNA